VTTFALLLSITISSATLAWGFSERGLTSFSTWILILGAGWLFAVWQEWEWYSTFGLVASVLMAAFGLWFGFVPGWMFASAIFALFAWDLFDFRSRTRSMVQDDNTRGIERRHLARISLLSFAGLLFASGAMLLRGKFNYEWGGFLAVIVLFGLTQLARWIKK